VCSRDLIPVLEIRLYVRTQYAHHIYYNYYIILLLLLLYVIAHLAYILYNVRFYSVNRTNVRTRRYLFIRNTPTRV